MTANMREMWILGKSNVVPIHQDDFLVLASAWENSDGSLNVVTNCNIQPGTQINLRPNQYKKTDKSPDLIFGVRRNQINVLEDNSVEVLAKIGE